MFFKQTEPYDQCTGLYVCVYRVRIMLIDICTRKNTLIVVRSINSQHYPVRTSIELMASARKRNKRVGVYFHNINANNANDRHDNLNGCFGFLETIF